MKGVGRLGHLQRVVIGLYQVPTASRARTHERRCLSLPAKSLKRKKERPVHPRNVFDSPKFALQFPTTRGRQRPNDGRLCMLPMIGMATATAMAMAKGEAEEGDRCAAVSSRISPEQCDATTRSSPAGPGRLTLATTCATICMEKIFTPNELKKYLVFYLSEQCTSLIVMHASRSIQAPCTVSTREWRRNLNVSHPHIWTFVCAFQLPLF